MKKTLRIFLMLCIIAVAVFALASCGDSSSVTYDPEDIVYVSEPNEYIGWVRVLGDYWKTNSGAAMAGFMVTTDDENIQLVVVGKTEASVTYHYDYNGYEYQYCKGSIEYEGETYYYNCGPMWFTNDVGNPMESSGSKWIYSAHFDKTEDMVKHLLQNGDLSKLAIPTISTADELKKLSGSNQTFVLANDIDLTGVEWAPITGFKGTLDGKGHKISNLTVSGSNGNFGLFDELNGASVTNLNLENVSVTAIGTTGDVGGLCGVAKNCTITNVTVNGTVSAILMDNVGGIMGYVENSKLKGNKNYASVTGFEQVGGVAGQFGMSVNSEDGVTENNDNYGEIKGLSTNTENGRIGGVFGRVNFWPGGYKSGATNWLYTIMNCNNYGSVANAGARTGGVIGGYTTSRWKSGDTYVDLGLANCTNEGAVTGNRYTGGIIGILSTCRTVINCENKGTVTALANEVGGIAGSGSASETFQMCKNSGAITGVAYVGGIIGYTGGIITACENSGTITATGQNSNCDTINEEGVACVGGIAGVSARYVSKSTNNGQIVSVGGGSCIGGIAGGMRPKIGDIIEGNVNNGNIDVTAGNMVGGIVGKIQALYSTSTDGDYTFSGKNTANVNAAQSWQVGGIAGYVSCQTSWSISFRTYGIFINCENSGTITGEFRVCGIIGTIWNYAKTDEIYWSTNKNTGTIVCDAAEKNDLYLMAS
ncbi:MAG: hypothetical protein IJ515_05195 [Clostridia bacterium]|nr:hypothetical protein [Clostridia bacterium]